MRSTNQIVTLVCLCVMGTVLLLSVSAALSLHALSERFSRAELRGVTEVLEQSLAQAQDMSRLEAWLPAVMKANGVKRLDVSLDGAPLLRYTDPDPATGEQALNQLRLAGSRYPMLHLHFQYFSPFSDSAAYIAPLGMLAGGIGLIVLLLWLTLGWLKRQLRGVELLSERAQLLLNGQTGKPRHLPEDEWPVSASQALSWLLSELEDAKKERSRFDTFIRRNVFIDKQLGIGNRIFFDNRLEAAMSDAEFSAGAVMLLELEGRDEILRQQGEAAAQDLMQECSQLVGQFLPRYADSLQGRYAGNVLAILLPSLNKQETLTAAEQLLKRLQHLQWPDYIDQERALYIGAVCYQPGELMAQIEEEAELALRGARLQQERGYFLYDKPLRQVSDKGSVRWRTLLERQFGRNQLTYKLQSAYCGKPPVLMLHEMLARLPDGSGKLLPAAGFVAMVEKVGMMPTFDQLMTQLALSLLPGVNDVPLALNLHPLTLLDTDYRRDLIMTLLRLGKRRAGMLVIEMNESQVSRYFDALREPLRELRLLGCRLSVDHAGQDVVSTHYIKEFELSFLKIHPSLVRDIQHRPLNQMAVRSLVGGCMNGQTLVIAIGVQSEDEWRVLQSLGVTGGQGFWFDHLSPVGIDAAALHS